MRDDHQRGVVFAVEREQQVGDRVARMMVEVAGGFVREQDAWAVHERAREGIDTFCVALDSQADSYAQRIFGPRGAIRIDSIERLDKLLPAIYLRLRA